MLPQPGTMGAGRAFSLSRVEAAEYFATDAARVTTGHATPGIIGFGNSWWLRSESSPNPETAHLTHNHGGLREAGAIDCGTAGIPGGIFLPITGLFHCSAASPAGLRPAVWVSVN